MLNLCRKRLAPSGAYGTTTTSPKPTNQRTVFVPRDLNQPIGAENAESTGGQISSSACRVPGGLNCSTVNRLPANLITSERSRDFRVDHVT